MFQISVILFAVINLFVDLFYLIYAAWLIVTTKIKLIRKGPNPLLQESVLSAICLTNDLDVFLHMNNARYIRHCDYARFKVLAETGIYSTLMTMGGTAWAGAHCVRYRRAMDPFTRYLIRAKILYWDDNAFYIEQKFVDKNNGFVYCVNITKQVLVRATMDQLLEKLDCKVEKPTPLPELSKWIESIELSRARLRKAE